jgi:hypothetical protein
MLDFLICECVFPKWMMTLHIQGSCVMYKIT